MYIDLDTLIHVWDDSNIFILARFQPSFYTDTLWSVFMYCFYVTYTVLLNQIFVEKDSELGDQFVYFSNLSRVNVPITGIVSQKQLYVRERNHHALRTSYQNRNCILPA